MKWQPFQREVNPELPPHQLFGDDVLIYLERETLPAVREPDLGIVLGSEFDEKQLLSAAALHAEVGFEPPRTVCIGRVFPSPFQSTVQGFLFVSVETTHSQITYGSVVDEMERTNRVRKLVQPLAIRRVDDGAIEGRRWTPVQQAERVKKLGRWLVGSIDVGGQRPQRVSRDEFAYLHELTQL